MNNRQIKTKLWIVAALGIASFASGSMSISGMGGSWSEAWGVSGDGSAVAGWSSGASGNEAFLWTQAGGMVGLGDLTGGSFSSIAYGISGDGSTVVGRGYDASGWDVFVWDEIEGMQSLKTVLEDGGVDMTGWTLSRATGVSDDGLTIVGHGTHNGGNTEGFVAVIPEPNVIALVGIFGSGLLFVRRYFRI